MKSLYWFVVVSLAIAGLGMQPSAAETIDNAAVIEMHKLGLGDDVIIEKIKSSDTKFKTDMKDLKELKEAGVSQPVIKEMIAGSQAAKPAGDGKKPAAKAPHSNDPKAMHPSGIYLYEEIDGKPKMTPLNPSSIGEVKTGGGFGMAWGGSAKTRAVLNGTDAKLQITNRKPTFYFYFDKTETSLSTADSSATDPDEFALSELEVKTDKDERRLVIGKAGWGGAKSGLDRKALRGFTHEAVGDGIYKVTLTEELAPGEYCFAYANRAVGLSGGKVFDFGIK